MLRTEIDTNLQFGPPPVYAPELRLLCKSVLTVNQNSCL